MKTSIPLYLAMFVAWALLTTSTGVNDARAGISAAPVTLNYSATVKGRMIYLGDLFNGLKEKADIPVAYAPAPGKQAIFDAKWLYRVARIHKIAWRPIGNRERAIVERISVVISRAEIEDFILGALQDRGVSANSKISLSNRMLTIHAPDEQAATLEVEDLFYNERNGKFSAILAIPAGNPSARRIRIAGTVFQMEKVPVPARRFSSGEIIRTADIDWIKVRADRLQNNIIVDADQLIGKAARRGLRKGKPVRTSDVRRPVMVPKGSIVIIVLKTPSMVLTAQGRAIEDGSKGDTIRIANSQSNAIVDAVVTGTGRVLVYPIHHIAMK